MYIDFDFTKIVNIINIIGLIFFPFTTKSSDAREINLFQYMGSSC